MTPLFARGSAGASAGAAAHNAGTGTGEAVSYGRPPDWVGQVAVGIGAFYAVLILGAAVYHRVTTGKWTT